MMESEIIDSKGVFEKFGVEPLKVIDVLGLMGDTADNIPGVRGVGEKTAIALIQEFGSIENIYANIDKVNKPKLRENLITYKADAMLAKRLVTIDTQVPLKINFHELNRRNPDAELTAKLFNELEFKSLLKKFISEEISISPKPNTGKQINEDLESDLKITITGDKVSGIEVNIPTAQKIIKSIEDTHHKYYTVKTNEEYIRLIKKLKETEFFSFDTETDSLDPMTAKLVGMSFSFNEHEGIYVPIIEAGEETSDSLFGEETAEEKIGIDVKFAIDNLKPLLESKKIKKVGQNIKYDYLIMRNYGIEIENIIFDTLIGSFILSPEGAHDMDSLSVKYLDYRPIPIGELIGKGKSQITMADVKLEIASEYAAEDADVTLQLFHRIKYELQKIGLSKLCSEIEFPLIKVIAEMEFAGIKVDENILKTLDEEITLLIKEYEGKIFRVAGETFNINSTQQLAKILFEKLKLNPTKKTKTGYSTDVSVLEELKNEHEIAALLVDYRMLSKLKSTYTEGLLKAINPKTKRVHTSFNQIGATTGRLSSVNPNLQNIPIRTETGRSIRKAFVAVNDNFEILSADYSQIELRIMAHFSGDENLIEAFKRNRDIHTETAKKVFGIESSKDVTLNMRRKAKEVNFGIIYGIGAFGLANRLEIRNSEAKEIIDRYFAEFPKVKDYMERTKQFARENGYVETITGRRRYLAQIKNQNAAARAEDERAAINMPIQGTAADMIKIAMINIYEDFLKKKFASKMLLQVHDELVFEVKKDEMEEVKKVVSREMRNALKLDVPIEVDIGVGKSWFEAH